MKMKKNLLLLALMLFFSGCVSAPENSLYGTIWRPEDSPEGARLEITPDGRIVGATPDNYFFAPVKFPEPGKVEFAAIAVTRRAGPNGEFEQKFLQALNETAGYRLEEGKLILLNGAGGEVLRLDFTGKSQLPSASGSESQTAE